MAIDFNALRARKGTNFQALQNKLEKTGQNGGFKKDERIWKPQANKDNKSASCRFPSWTCKRLKTASCKRAT